MVLCASLTGCCCFIDPGPIDPTPLNRYQDALVRHAWEHPPKTQPLTPADPNIGTQLNATKTQDQAGRTIFKAKLTLTQAVRMALANNLNIRVAGFDPEISREEMIQAAAVFDAIVFAGWTYGVQDQRENNVFDRTSLAKSHTLQAGVRKHLTSGADVTATYSLTRLASKSQFVTKPTTYEPNLTLEIVQPLLRGAGCEVNLAALRVASINRKTSEQAFRQTVEATVADAVAAYWALYLAQRELAIQQDLLTDTQDIYDKVWARRDLDASKLHIQQAGAAVLLRKAIRLRAAKNVDDVADALAQLVFGSQAPMPDRIEIEIEAPRIGKVISDGEGQLLTALRESSLLAQARLAVQAAGINVRVAENSLLPTLNLQASATWMGLDKLPRGGHDQILDSKYLSYSVGLLFEYAWGNRDPRAGARLAKFERLQAMVNLQNVALQITRTVKERIREIERAYADLQIVTKALKANEARLEAIEAEEKIRGRLTPEFLQLKLQALESVGSSRRDVEQAVVDYQTALVQLWQTTGTVLKHYGVATVVGSEARGDE